jgi:hypothetical protein
MSSSTSPKEIVSGLIDVLAEPQPTEAVGDVWSQIADEWSEFTEAGTLSDSAAGTLKDLLKPADSMSPTTSWSSRDFARAAVALGAWTRAKGLSAVGKAWIGKLGGAAPESNDAAINELALTLYRKLLAPLRAGGPADALTARQRVLLTAFVTQAATAVRFMPANRVEGRKALHETPDGYVSEILRRGLIEKGADGGASTVVADWPSALNDPAKFRDAFWPELRDLVEGVRGGASIFQLAAALLIAALLVGLIFNSNQLSKRNEEIKAIAAGLKAYNVAPGQTPAEMLKAVEAFVADKDKVIAATANEREGAKGELKSTLAKLAAETTERTKVEGIRDDLKKVLADKEEKLAKAGADLAATKGELDKTRQAVADAKVLFDKKAGELVERTKDLKATTESLTATAAERDKLRKDLDATAGKLGDATKALAAAEARIAGLEGDKKRLDSQLGLANDALAATKTKLADTAKSLAAAEKGAADLTKKAADAEAAVKTARETAAKSLADSQKALADSQKAVASARAEADAAKAKAEEVAAQVKTLTEKSVALEAGKAKAETELKAARDEAESLRRQLREAKTKTPEVKPEKAPDGETPKSSARGGSAAKTELLGAVLRDITDEDRKALGLGTDVKGVIVHEVKAGGKAAAAGLKADEVLVRLTAEFSLPLQTVSQEVPSADVRTVASFADKVALLKRDNKFKGWKLKLLDRTVSVEE